MKKLFDVDIFGLKVPVWAKKGMLETGKYGVSQFEPNKIIIDSDLSLDEFTQTLAHECIHFMFFRLNLQLPDEIEEMLCETSIIPIFKNLKVQLPQNLLDKFQSHQKKTQKKASKRQSKR